ncbi:putative nuclear envelope pore membrane protein POM 121B isoform X2 [Vombatus ursinus]|uniref:RING-type domain-containing protein n=1 Tax=Vombatus ursinus TaxID=29139 RepID=A0A4X2L6P5_VOMUR|nr:putative nuclear envelope pore membrane protein POM 121B isoform X2 [Vombatus ursinus]
MAELQPLADELTCSICLEIFQQPVTTPCGHNFCSPCLDKTWTGQSFQFYCPQCRARFQKRPQLKKNTVLCAVVGQLQQVKNRWDLGQSHSASQDGEPLDPQSRKGDQEKDEAVGIVACDYCLQTPAAKTCFTCMASFCQEHLRPHLDNPTFHGHELQSPVGDLARRKCPEHGRLREFFCSQHGVSICCICLVGHKTCSPVALDVARTELKSKMKQKLTIIYDHINMASSALRDVKLKQRAVQDTAARKMDLLKHEYEEMKALIESEEKSSLRKLKEEEKRVLDKYDHMHQVLLKKKGEIESMKEEIELLLTKSDEIAFLEKASNLVTKAVNVPKNELNLEMIHSVFQKAVSLKEALKNTINFLQEKKTEEATISEGDIPEPKPQRQQQEKSGITDEKTPFSSPAAPLASGAKPLLDSVEKMQSSPSPAALTDPAGAASAEVPSPLKPASPPIATGPSESAPAAATSSSSFPTSCMLASLATLLRTTTSQASPAPVSDNSVKPLLTTSPKPSLFGMLSTPPLTSTAPTSAAASVSPPSTSMFKAILGASPKMESEASLPAVPSARAPVSCSSVLPTAPTTSTATFKPIFDSMDPITSVPLDSVSPFLKQPSSVASTTAVTTTVLAPLFSILGSVQSPAASATPATTSSSGTTDSGSKPTFSFGLSSLASTVASAPPTTTTTTTPSLSQPFLFGVAPTSGASCTPSTGFMFQFNKPAATATTTTAVMTTTSFSSTLSFGGSVAPNLALPQLAFGMTKPPTSFVTPASTQPAFGSTNSVFSFGMTTPSSFGATTQTTSSGTSSSVFSSVTLAPFTFGSSSTVTFSFRASQSGAANTTTPSGGSLNQNSLGAPSQSTPFAFSLANTTKKKPVFGGTSTPTFEQKAPAPGAGTVDSGLSFGTPTTSAQSFAGAGPSFKSSTPLFSFRAGSKTPGPRQQLKAQKQHNQKK